MSATTATTTCPTCNGRRFIPCADHRGEMAETMCDTCHGFGAIQMTATLTADEVRAIRDGLWCVANYWRSEADRWEARTEDGSIDPQRVAERLRDKASAVMDAFGKIGC